MKSISLPLMFLRTVASFSEYFLILISLAILNHVEAQNCTNPPAQGQQTAWAQNTPITVNINPNQFTSNTQSQALQEAFTNWQSANGVNGNASNVTFLKLELLAPLLINLILV